MQRFRFLPIALVAAASGLASLAASPAAAQIITPPPSNVQARPAALPQTWVLAYQTGEVVRYRTATFVKLTAPEFMRFEWGTNVKDVDEVEWKLVPMDAPDRVLAKGVSKIGPTTTRPNFKGGTFSLDLRHYLPASPTATPQLYQLRVTARKYAPVRRQPGSGAIQPISRAMPVGPLPNPVTISYAKPEPVNASFDTCYQKVTLVLDRFELFDDQWGPGKEEYHVAGFAQELLPPGPKGSWRPGRHKPIGPAYWVMNPPKTKQIGTRLEFPLGQIVHDKKEWPRRFLLGLSVLEEDGGDMLPSWRKAMGVLGDTMAKPGIYEMSRNEVESYFKKKMKDVGFWLDVGRAFADIASVASAAAGSTATAGVGAAVAVVITVVKAIIDDSGDDYYGTEAGLLTLKSTCETVIREIPGKFVGTGDARKYVTGPTFMRFYGPPAGPQSMIDIDYDGVVDIVYHWEFENPTL